MAAPAVRHGLFVKKHSPQEIAKVGGSEIRVDVPLNSVELAQLKDEMIAGERITYFLRGRVELRRGLITFSDGTHGLRELLLRKEGNAVVLKYDHGNPIGYNTPTHR